MPEQIRHSHMREIFDGSCHCGAVGFRYETSIAPEDWSIRACQCRFCRAHDALSTSDPEARIIFTIVRPQYLHRYRFGLRTADFLLCKQCGVYVGAVIRIGDNDYGIINTRALLTPPENIAMAAPIVYDAEDVEKRIARRENRWASASFDASVS